MYFSLVNMPYHISSIRQLPTQMAMNGMIGVIVTACAVQLLFYMLTKRFANKNCDTAFYFINVSRSTICQSVRCYYNDHSKPVLHEEPIIIVIQTSINAINWISWINTFIFTVYRVTHGEYCILILGFHFDFGVT